MNIDTNPVGDIHNGHFHMGGPDPSIIPVVPIAPVEPAEDLEADVQPEIPGVAH